jgi:FtsZ-binding cell division protein ZapB
MTTIDPNRALPVYQARVSNMINDIILRDIAIADLEEGNLQLQQENASLRQENASLRMQVHDPAADAGSTAPADLG